LAAIGGLDSAYSHGAECGGKSIQWPCIQRQSMFYGGWQRNYYCQQKLAGQANEQSISLDVYVPNRYYRVLY